MTLLVDTSVWSLAFRRDRPPAVPQLAALLRALEGGDALVATGLILQELLQGFSGPRDSALLILRVAAIPLVMPDRRDHVEAAALRNHCRRGGVQLGTVDALIAQLCIRHDLTLLSTDLDFSHAAAVCELKVWAPA